MIIEKQEKPPIQKLSDSYLWGGAPWTIAALIDNIQRELGDKTLYFELTYNNASKNLRLRNSISTGTAEIGEVFWVIDGVQINAGTVEEYQSVRQAFLLLPRAEPAEPAGDDHVDRGGSGGD